MKEAIDIFEEKTEGSAQGLFAFYNAPSHQKRAPDALFAQKMPKNPTTNWKTGPKMKMRNAIFADRQQQELYYPMYHPTMPGWFKGMEQIIHEWGLWPAGGLNTECKSFKCKPGCTDCCCHCLLFTQPDFCSQKSQLEEYITSQGQISL